MNYSEKDFEDFNKFLLKWRFSGPNINFPKNSIKFIHPFNTIKSNEIWNLSLKFIDRSENNFKPSKIFYKIKTLENLELKENIEIIAWLNENIPADNEKLILSWQPDTSILTTREVFINFWDDFCYPGSDDISIFSKSELWILHYWHEESFYFAIKQI